MNKRNKNYIPKSSNNPVVQAKKIEKLKHEIDLHGKNIDAISKSHDTHITILSNFARHDIKNSIQSIDSIVSTNTQEEITEEHLDSIKLNLKIMRETIDNFSKLVPHNQTEEFSFQSLITAIELLNRNSFYDNQIEFIRDKVSEKNVYFKLPFQSVLQMVNNTIINATKSLQSIKSHRKIRIQGMTANKSFQLKVFDNGEEVDEKIENKIFEYGISSTGGSGIGLFHAKYLCDLYKGSIKHISLEPSNEFTKCFLISLPTLDKTE